MFFKVSKYLLVLEFEGSNYLRQFASLPEASHLADLSDFCSFEAIRAKVSIAKLIER